MICPNATPFPIPVGSVAGSVNFAPKPEPDQAYAVMNGVVLCATAMAVLVALKATEYVASGGKEGSAYFVPNPEPDQG